MTNIIPISDVRANLPKIVEEINKTDSRVIITVKGRAKVVMLSTEELEAIEETAEILAIPGALESIKRGERDAKRGKGIPLSELK